MESNFGVSTLRLIFYSLAAVALSIVALAGGGTGRSFETNRSYRRDLFATSADCTRARRAGTLNCSNWVDFGDDGRVNLVLADTVNDGSYEIEGDKIHLHFASLGSGFGNAPRDFTFSIVTVASGSDHLVDLTSNGSWERIASQEP
jgi:hypothetical protein